MILLRALEPSRIESAVQKNIAITGATGLLGAHLANTLIEKGHEVFALIKDENSKSILSKKVTRIYGDIGEKSDIEYFIQKANPNYFIHLAAQTQAYNSLRYPYQTFFNNMVGTLNVMECLREFGLCEAIVIASSDKAYGELVGETYTEEHQLRGVYPYDASKSVTDLIANSYRVSYGMPVAITRACNIYGIGDYNPQRLIPGVVAAFIKQRRFVIRNQGKDLREYIHVSDVVTAYEKIIEHVSKENRIGAFNISSGDRKSTLEVFEMIEKIIGKKIDSEIAQGGSLEIKRQFMDSTLLRSTTGWTPQIHLSDIMQETVDWYLANL
jgi:CDP-glucose 4,6-dehydratase